MIALKPRKLVIIINTVTQSQYSMGLKPKPQNPKLKALNRKPGAPELLS